MVSQTYTNNQFRLLTNIGVDFAQFYKNQYRLVYEFNPQNNNQSLVITNLVSYTLHEIYPTDPNFRNLQILSILTILKEMVFLVCVCVCLEDFGTFYIKTPKYLINISLWGPHTQSNLVKSYNPWLGF